LTGLSLIVISIACGIPFTQVTQPETETETPTSVPTSSPAETSTTISLPTQTATLELAATEFIPPATSTPKFAPFCEPSSASVATPIVCQVPIAEQSSSFCSKKTPYNLILINPGSTYEVLGENIECTDAGVKDNKLILTCTGPMVTAFELEVCDPACSIPIFQTGLTHCPQDYTFNEFFGCCEQKPHPIDANCVTLKLQTRSCVIECSEFTDQKTCDKNAYACVWDKVNDVCLLKK
jgi:hypothetical protein